MAWRLPKKIEFPWGFDITVSVVDRAEMDDDHAEWVCERNSKDQFCGGSIRLARDLSPAEKRACLIHELGHAYLDWQSWASMNVPLKEPQAAEPDPNEKEEEEGDGKEEG